MINNKKRKLNVRELIVAPQPCITQRYLPAIHIIVIDVIHLYNRLRSSHCLLLVQSVIVVDRGIDHAIDRRIACVVIGIHCFVSMSNIASNKVGRGEGFVVTALVAATTSKELRMKVQ
jgi:hypothetical protein